MPWNFFSLLDFSGAVFNKSIILKKILDTKNVKHLEKKSSI